MSSASSRALARPRASAPSASRFRGSRRASALFARRRPLRSRDSSSSRDVAAPPVPPPIRAAASSSSGFGGPPVNRLDEGAARERVMRLASQTAQGAGALEAISGCLASMPGATNHRLALFRFPTPKSILDTVALNLHQPRWVVAFDALANAPRRPGDPPFCFGVTHPAEVPPAEAIEPGADPVAPAVGSVGFVCRLDDVYHDNKEERLYVTSKVVGRFRVDRVVADHPFFVAETSEVFDEAIEDDDAGEEAERKALREAEMRVWALLLETERLGRKIDDSELASSTALDYDARRCSPIVSERPPWDADPPAPERRAELFSWAVARRCRLTEAEHLRATRTTSTRERLELVVEKLEEGVRFLAAVSAVEGEAGEEGIEGDDKAGEGAGEGAEARKASDATEPRER